MDWATDTPVLVCVKMSLLSLPPPICIGTAKRSRVQTIQWTSLPLIDAQA